MSFTRAWGAIRREIAAVVGLALVLVPIGVALSGCLIGVPIVVFALGRLAAVLVAGARAADEGAERDTRATGWAGFVATLGIAILASAMAFAAIAIEALAPSLALEAVAPLALELTVALAAALLVGVALAPFAFAPFVLADAGGGVFTSIARSFELTARLGPRQLARLGASVGAVLGGSILAVAALFLAGADDTHGGPFPTLVLAAPFAIMPGPPIAFALLADAYVQAARGAASDGERLPVRGKLLALGLVLVPALLVAAIAVLVAALTPVPMRAVAMNEPVRRGIHGEGLTAEPQQRPIANGVFARTTARGVAIEAPDGGGAGELDARFDTTESALYVQDGARYGGARGTYAVIVTNGDRWALTLVNADGVRQDDSLVDRVAGRLGRGGGWALIAGLALALLLVFAIASRLGEARALAAPELRAEGARGGALAALEGTLRLGEGASVRSLAGLRVRLDANRPRAPIGNGPHLIVVGDVWLEADDGALRFRVPEGFVPALGAASSALDGSPAVLLSRFERVGAAGLREAGVPWPRDGRLVIGRRADAAAALVARASAVAVVFAIPALIALAFAAVKLISSL